jgi:hypothetical protein
MTGFDNPAATGGTALIASLAIQYLKNSGWATWFTRETNRANLALSILVAGALSVGIHFTWDAATDTFAIVGLQGFVRHGLWEWFLQWVAGHATYKGFIVPAETLGEIRALLARALPPPITEGAQKALDGTPERTGRR